MENVLDVMDPDQYDCAGCAYYAPQVDGVGSCHRYAPRSRGWPKTTDAGMCGEHSVWTARLKQTAIDHLESQLERLEHASAALMIAAEALQGVDADELLRRSERATVEPEMECGCDPSTSCICYTRK